MGKKVPKVSEIKSADKKAELVELLIREIPNCFDSFPKSSIARSAVEKLADEILK